ncbi:hypothetical protein BDF14DRAFT_787153 [Spinellus fusiger]|nr:hypothetical protein BDF14DRAFT_787153 [Spinellus fusiger]
MAHILGTTQRRLETVLEDFKRARTYWSELNAQGFPIANKLVNAVIQSKYVDDTAYWHPALVQAYPNVLSAYDRTMATVVDDLHTKLKSVVNKMAVQQKKMQQHHLEIKALHTKLLQTGGDVLASQPLFKTCPLSFYLHAMDRCVSMYATELTTKQSLVSPQGLIGIKTKDESLTLLSIWLHQPSLIEKDLQTFLQIASVELS